MQSDVDALDSLQRVSPGWDGKDQAVDGDDIGVINDDEDRVIREIARPILARAKR